MPHDAIARRSLWARVRDHIWYWVQWLLRLPLRLVRRPLNWLRELWTGKFTVRTIVTRLLWAVAAVVALLFLVTIGLIFYPNTQIVSRPKPDQIVYLDQGWGPDANSPDRQSYYFTPQGTTLKGLRYDWFVKLERPWGRQLFSDPEHMRSYGFWLDAEASEKNPDHLPVGFAKHFDPELDDYVLDISCAACHTGQLTVRKNGQLVAVRVDGGAAMHAFTAMNIGHFGPTLLGAMASTYVNPLKFGRFADRVLGRTHDPDARSRLRSNLRAVLKAFVRQAYVDKSRHLYPVEEGFGRTDAVGRISNTVFGENLDEANYRVADAPVSFPPVWEIWKFDWVQYTGSVRQPMARNLGETMGVGARFKLTDEYGRPLPPDGRFHTTTRFFDLEKLENTIWKLKPPEWPEDVLGKVDWCKASRGRDLFEQSCQHCHGVNVADRYQTRWNSPLKVCKQYSEDDKGNIACEWRDNPDPEWITHLLPVEDIGTDPAAARNFNDVRVDLSRSRLTKAELERTFAAAMGTDLRRELAYYRDKSADARRQGKTAEAQALDEKRAKREVAGPQEIRAFLANADTSSVTIGAGLSFYGYLMRELFYRTANLSPQRQAELNGWNTLDLPQVVMVYKARPLAGIWATAPFLHNGSVPTLYHMLVPATERPKEFYVGSHEFDPARVGYRYSDRQEGAFRYDTTIPGNLNFGHEFRAGYVGWKPGDQPGYGVIGPQLSEDDRWALVEYLKVHRDEEDSTLKHSEKNSQACRLPGMKGGK